MSPHTKVALVTGAGTGIGKAVALAFLQEGYRVTLTGRRKELLEQTVTEAGTAAGQALIVPTDVRDPALYGPCLRRRSVAFDVLFNNAGVSAPGIASKISAMSSGKRWWTRTSQARFCAPRRHSRS